MDLSLASLTSGEFGEHQEAPLASAVPLPPEEWGTMPPSPVGTAVASSRPPLSPMRPVFDYSTNSTNVTMDRSTSLLGDSRATLVTRSPPHTQLPPQQPPQQLQQQTQQRRGGSRGALGAGVDSLQQLR